MKYYKYDHINNELVGSVEFSKEFGLDIPFTTSIKPLEVKEGYSQVFTDKWVYVEDNRGKEAFNKETKARVIIDYLGEIKDTETLSKPIEVYEKYDYTTNKWVEDTEKKEQIELQTQI